MASGKYGTIAPSFISPNDIDIVYTFQSNRSIDSNIINSLNPSDVITTYNEIGSDEVMGGLYKLKLPANIFNQVGTYTLFIRPKRIKTTILDCGGINTLPDVKGIVLDSTSSSLTPIANKLSNGGLSGFRIEYLDDNGQVIPDAFTIVTWSNRCEAISQNVGNSTQKSISYRFNDSGSLVFLTLTPSVSTNALPSIKPFIGKPNQSCYIINTYFDPITIEVNLTHNDIDTLSYSTQSSILENVKTGRLTVFDFEGNIYNQRVSGVIKDSITSTELYKFVQKVDDIDSSETMDNALSDSNLV